MVRDNALSVSGLLADKVGGKSVFPYQPAGYWFALNFPTREWQNDKGEGLYRRGLYTHWQRSFLHPSLLAFDAPTREEAVCERSRSNIPQQALVLLNDPTYVEAARVFAEKIVKRRRGDRVGANRLGVRTTRWTASPRPEETAVLAELFAEAVRTSTQQDPAAARQLLTVGDHPRRHDDRPGGAGRVDGRGADDLEPARDDYEELVRACAWTDTVVARGIASFSRSTTRRSSSKPGRGKVRTVCRERRVNGVRSARL